MTTYDASLDLVTAARRHLVADTALAALVGTSPAFQVWVFRWRPYVIVEGTGQAAVVLAQRAGWQSPNMHNNMEFPRLQVEVWADLERDVNGNPASRTAEDLASDVLREVSRILHHPRGDLQEWGDTNGKIRVLRSTRLDEMDIVDVPNGDGLVRGTVNFGVVLG